VVGRRLLPALRAASQPPTRAKDHPQRRLTDADADDLRHIIQELFPRDQAWEVACVHDDEACMFARELRTFMIEQGFEVGSRGVVRAVFERPAIGLALERRAGGYRLIVGRNPEPDEKPGLARTGVGGLAGLRRSGDMHWLNWWRILPPIRLRRSPPGGPSIERQDDDLPPQENEVVIAARPTSKAG
jgi:hypothetical protein